MEKLLHKLRMWLLRLLNGLPWEKYNEDATIARRVYDREYDRLNEHIRYLDCLIGQYKEAVREICRRSDDSYYDWCCDYCRITCDKRNGWCKRFAPRNILYVDIEDRFTAGDIAK